MNLSSQQNKFMAIIFLASTSMFAAPALASTTAACPSLQTGAFALQLNFDKTAPVSMNVNGNLRQLSATTYEIDITSAPASGPIAAGQAYMLEMLPGQSCSSQSAILTNSANQRMRNLDSVSPGGLDKVVVSSTSKPSSVVLSSFVKGDFEGGGEKSDLEDYILVLNK